MCVCDRTRNVLYTVLVLYRHLMLFISIFFFFSSRRRHTRCALVTGVQTCALPIYGFLIVFFCFFYTALVFDSRETADNLKKSGAFVPGVRQIGRASCRERVCQYV